MLKLTGRRYRPFTIPGIGPLLVRSLTEVERARVESIGSGTLREFKRTIVILSLVDGVTKEPLFADSDMELLGTMDGVVIDQIVSETIKLNKITDEDYASLLGKLADT